MRSAPPVVNYRPTHLSPNERADLDEQVRAVLRESDFLSEVRDELSAPQTLSRYVTGTGVDLLSIVPPARGVASWIVFESGSHRGAHLTLIAVRKSNWRRGFGRALLTCGLERYASEGRVVSLHTQNPVLVSLWLNECVQHSFEVEPSPGFVGETTAAYRAAAAALQNAYRMSGTIELSRGVKRDPSSGTLSEVTSHRNELLEVGGTPGGHGLKDRIRELLGRLEHPADMLTLIGFPRAKQSYERGGT